MLRKGERLEVGGERRKKREDGGW